MLPEYDFISHLTYFCRALRRRGLLVGPQETTDAARALAFVDLLDRGRVYWTLRSVLLSRPEQFDVFDELFERFWNFEPLPEKPHPTPENGRTDGLLRFRRRRQAADPLDGRPSSSEMSIQIVRTGASAAEVISETDLTAVHPDRLFELSRIANRMVQALASRPGRRRRRHKRKGALDLRGAFRLSLATGGDPIRLPRLRRVPRVPRVLVLLDVSGSMDRYAKLLMQLIYAVVQHTSRVETFVFSTSVTRVTRELKAPSFGEALRRISASVDHWSGGTRIDRSLGLISADHPALQDRYTTVLLLSDGWDTGDPETLAQELRRMHRRVRSIVWLNPLLGTMDYEPLTRGLQAAIPYVDHFLPASDISHLKRLPQLLRG